MAKRSLYQHDHNPPYRLSRSKVDLFLDCKRCFYLDQKIGIKRPPGFPFNLNSAVDALLKAEFDHYRNKALPHPYMKGAGLNAIPFQHPELDTWRNNFKGISFIHEATGFEAFGAVDDLWLDLNTKEIIVVDYKSTSKTEAVTLNAEWQIGYKRQMEFYQWLLRQRGFSVAIEGWFVYCNGIKDKSAFNQRLDFTVSMLPYLGNDDWVEPTLHAIKECLDSDLIPAAAENCEFCCFAEKYADATRNPLIQRTDGERSTI